MKKRIYEGQLDKNNLVVRSLFANSEHVKTYGDSFTEIRHHSFGLTFLLNYSGCGKDVYLEIDSFGTSEKQEKLEKEIITHLSNSQVNKEVCLNIFERGFNPKL